MVHDLPKILKLLGSNIYFYLIQVLPLKKYYMQSAKKFHKQLLGGVQTSSSLYEISCEEDTEHDILMELYGQGSDGKT